MKELLLKEPYRIFFPLGIFYLFVGASLWLPTLTGSLDSYPIYAHKYFMLNGFVYSFMAGFIFTALPQFASSLAALKREVASFILVTLFGAFTVFFVVDAEQVTYFVSFLQAFILLMFIVLRMRNKEENPPFMYLFLIVGFLLHAVFSLLHISMDISRWSINDLTPMTLVLMGVGGRLFPGVLGHKNIVKEQRQAYEQDKRWLLTIPVSLYLLVGIMLVSFFVKDSLSHVLQMFVIIIWGVQYCRINKFPVIRSSLTWGIWVSLWMIIFDVILGVVWPEGGIHASHLLFVGGFYSLIHFVATRVLRVHSGKGIELETSKTLWFFLGMVVLAATTRVSAIIFPQVYLSHLGYSASLLMIASFVWAKKYLVFIRDTP